MRLSRMVEAPKAIVMPCVWDWVPENMTINTGQLNQRRPWCWAAMRKGLRPAAAF